MSDSPPWLAKIVAVAQEFHDEKDAHAVIRAAAYVAVDNVEGCDLASISLVRRAGHVETLGSTDVAGAIGDMMQFALGEGPCLDVAWDDRSVHSCDLLDDHRWPAWGTRMSRDYDTASVLCLPLLAHEDHVCTLSLYSRTRGALRSVDRGDGLALVAPPWPE